MTYEDEQIKYAEELKEITFAISRLDEIFEDSSKTDVKILEYYKQLNPSRFQFSSSFEIQQQISLFRNLLEEDYRRKTARKKELERLLSQTSAERTKDNTKAKTFFMLLVVIIKNYTPLFFKILTHGNKTSHTACKHTDKDKACKNRNCIFPEVNNSIPENFENRSKCTAGKIIQKCQHKE